MLGVSLAGWLVVDDLSGEVGVGDVDVDDTDVVEIDVGDTVLGVSLEALAPVCGWSISR